jgi:hypothetical protein
MNVADATSVIDLAVAIVKGTLKPSSVEVQLQNHQIGLNHDKLCTTCSHNY